MAPQAAVRYERPARDTLVLVLVGDWLALAGTPRSGDALALIDGDPALGLLAFDATALARWDTGLLVYLVPLLSACRRNGITVRTEGLPSGARNLLALASGKPAMEQALPAPDADVPFLAKVGEEGIGLARSTGETLAFLGRLARGVGRTLLFRARFRRRDLFVVAEEVGARALPIVTLISVLVGMTLTFVGAMQLELFNAQIYVADLVGIGMTREMGALMTGIIMAGRSGAAFAAHLGSMQVNEEIDALKTMGVDPVEYLILPRVLAMIVMMPLLCVYADALGILGGAFVSGTLMDIPFAPYLSQTQGAVGMDDLFSGLIKAGVFGVIVAVTGCLQGMRCGRSSSAIGSATTAAVVTGIVSIVVADSLLTVLFLLTGF